MADLGNNAVFSQTDANNNSGTQPGWPEGTMLVSAVNDAGRAFQGAVKREHDWRNATVSSGGTAAAYTLTYAVAPAAYYKGQEFSFKAHAANGTSESTLNVNGLGAKSIKVREDGVLRAIGSNAIFEGDLVRVSYDDTANAFILVSRPGQANGLLAGGYTIVNYGTKALLEAATVGSTVTVAYVLGHTTTGIGAAYYVKVAAEPSHPGKIKSIDNVWFEIAMGRINPEMFGGFSDNDTVDNTTAINNAIECASEAPCILDGEWKRYRCLSEVTILSNVVMENIYFDYADATLGASTSTFALRIAGTISNSVPLVSDAFADNAAVVADYRYPIDISAANISAIGGLAQGDLLHLTSSRVWDVNYSASSISDGTFTAITGWTLGTGWTGTTSYTHSAGTGSDLTRNPAVAPVVGATYTVTFTVSAYSAGNVKPKLIGGTTVNGSNVSANGSYTQTLVAVSGNTNVAFECDAAFVGTIADITVTRWGIGTGWAIASGVATKTAGSGSDLSQPFPTAPTATNTYRVQFIVSNYTAGTVKPKFTGGSTVNGASVSANGTYSQLLTVASGNTTFALEADATFAGSIDGVTVSLRLDSTTSTNTLYGAGEIATIRDIADADTVNLAEPPLYDYIVSEGAVARKITPKENILLRNVKVIGPVPMEAYPTGSNIKTVNGDFATDTDWTKGAGWTISAGVATHAVGTTSSLTQAISLTAGKDYFTQITVTAMTAGGITPKFTGGTTVLSESITAAGTYVFVMRAVTGNATIEFEANADFDGSIDDVSVIEGRFFGGLWIENARNVKLEGCYFQHLNVHQTFVLNSVNIRISDTDYKDAPTWYGVSVSNACRDVKVKDCTFVNIRHAVTGGATATYYGGTVNALNVSGCYAVGREATFDTHPGVDTYRFTDNYALSYGDPTEQPGGSTTDVATYGFNMQGRSGVLQNNIVRGFTGKGIQIQCLLENPQDKFSIIATGNMIFSNAVPVAASSYGIYLQINNIADCLPDQIIISDNEIKGPFAAGIYLHASQGSMESAIISGNIITGCTVTGIFLHSNFGSITNAVISSNIIEAADPAADLGITFQVGLAGQFIKHVVCADNVIKNCLTAIRRQGTLGEVSVKLNNNEIAATNLVAGFASGDRYMIDGVGVMIKTANYTLTHADIGWTVSNEGAAGSITISLPTAIANIHFGFVVATAQPLVIDANTSDVIYSAAGASSLSGTATSSTKGNSIYLAAANAVDWLPRAQVGTWTMA